MTQGAVNERVAVIGSGMVGLVLAWRARAAGHHVTLFEGADAVGGLASSWTVGPVTWDRYYHVILGADAAWRSLLAELGLDAEIRWRATRTGCLVDGRVHSVSGPFELLRFRPLPVVSRVRIGATLAMAAVRRDGAALERVLVADWLRRWSGAAAFDRFWAPLLRAKLGTAWPRTSAAFLWATAQRLGRARGNGLGDEQFGYVPGGYTRILAALDERLRADGVNIRLRTPVRGVASGSDGPVVTTDRGSEPFDRVLVTAACPVAARLLHGLRPDEVAALERVEYQGAVCVSVVLDAPLHPFYVTNLLDDTTLTAIVDMSALVDPAELGGHGLVYLPRYCAPDDPLFDAEPDDVASAFVAELTRLHPAAAARRVVATGVARARHVFAVPTLHASSHTPPFATSLAGVALVNSAQIVNATLNVDESVQLADRAFADLFGAEACGVDPSARRPVTPATISVTRAVTNTDGAPGASAAPGGAAVGSSRPLPTASLSLDLDNEWAYLMTHGDERWRELPTYLPVAVPRVLDELHRLGLTITFFVVGQDCVVEANREPIAAIAAAGHEVANHSFRHQPWLHRYARREIADELARAEDAITALTGVRPTGFRGPGYSLSPDVLDVLVQRGYRYDASTLPTYIGPLARAFYFRSARLTAEQRAERALLFGTFAEGTQPLHAYRFATHAGPIVELPVSTLPGAKVPVHISYLLYLAAVAPAAADAYFRAALRTCRATGLEPSILLHPLDFLGADDVASLGFFPAMSMGGRRKTELVRGWLQLLAERFDIVGTGAHVERILAAEAAGTRRLALRRARPVVAA